MPKLRLKDGLIRDRISAVESEKRELLNRQVMDTHLYEVYCASHSLSPAANRPIPIYNYANKATALRSAAWAGGIVASGVFALLNVFSLASPPAVTVLGSVVFAVLIGYLAHCIMAFLSPVDAMEPQSARGANYTLVIAGLLAIGSFSVFLYLRFSGSEFAGAALPAIAMTFELATLTFVATAWELLPLYTWPRRLAEDFDRATEQITKLDAILATCKAQIAKEDVHNDDELEANDDRPGSLPVTSKPGARKPNGSASDHSGLR